MIKLTRQQLIDCINAEVDERQTLCAGGIADAIIAESDKQPTTTLDLIAAESEKQISKGYTVEHDAAYTEETKITFDTIAIDLINRYQCPPNWEQRYWDKLCALPEIDRKRIAATWMARELERLLFIQNKEA